MAINWPLTLVGPLFFLALLAMLYLLAWISVVGAIRALSSRITHTDKKRVLAIAIALPLLLAVLPTLMGIGLRHQHAHVGIRHHSNACAAAFQRLVGADSPPEETERPWHAVAGLSANGFVWLLVLSGAFSAARMAWATTRLGRSLEAVSRLPSPPLEAAIQRVARHHPRISSAIFREADIPMNLTGLLGLGRVRCVVSAELVRTASEGELDAIVVHEANHLRAGDTFSMFLVGALERLFYFLRPVQALCKRWRDEAELACDAAAVAKTREPLSMASAILRVSGVPVGSGATPVSLPRAAGQSATRPLSAVSRVENLLVLARSTSLWPVADSRGHKAFAWLATVLCVGLGVGLASSTQVACSAHCAMEAIARALP